MPKFSESSLTKLKTCHPELQILFMDVIRYFDCTVLEGYRNQADQERAVEIGNSQLHYPFGNHNKSPSMAVDVSPYPVQWDNINRFYWFAGFVMGVALKLKEAGKMSMSVRYGGDWNKNFNISDNKFNDLVHFELIT